MKSAWMIAGTLLLLAVAALVIYLVTERQKADAHEVKLRLQHVYQALIAYDSEHQGLPAPITFGSDGQPLYSWRFELMPYIESPQYPIHPELAWTDQEHVPWREVPAAPYVLLPGRPKGKPATTGSVYAVVGPGTPFSSPQPLRLRELPGDTILIVETTRIGKHWMEPGDFDIERLGGKMARLGEMATGEVPGIVHVVFADGQVWGLSSQTPINNVRAFFVQAGGERSRERLLLPYRVN